MSWTCGELQIGRQIRFREIRASSNFAVFEVQPDNGEPFAIIARQPRTKYAAIGFQPNSVAAPFKSTEKAIEALFRWANNPASPPLPPKPKAPGGRRNSNRPRQQSDAGGQMFLAL